MNWRSILGRASRTAPVTNDEADDIARARLAAIAGRTTGRVVSFTPPVVAELPVEAVAAEPELATVADDLDDIDGRQEAESSVPIAASFDAASAAVDTDAPVPNEPDPASDADAIGVSAADEFSSMIESTGGDADDIVAAVDETALGEPETSDAAAEQLVSEAEFAEAEAEADDGVAAAPLVSQASLDDQIGFPWTARFIALWTREVADVCPAELGDAIRHWQRWADQQNAGAPLVEEACEEFTAMIATWRDEKGAVPGLAAADPVMRQLVDEAADDPRLAAVLPETLRPMPA